MGMKVFKDYPLLLHNTFGMDVKAALFIEYGSVEELKEVLRMPEVKEGRWLHIGGGSNLLFTGDYPGAVLHSAIKGHEIVKENGEEVIVRVGAGEVWDDFVAYTVAQGWYGAENLSLIPGGVGASAVQNIGAYGVEVKDLITHVEAIEVATGQERIFTNEECGYAYRESVFKLSSSGMIAGSYVIDGKITRNSKIRVVRDGIVISEDEIASLRRFKDDVKEVATGYECGIGLERFNDIKEGDILEAYIVEEYKD